MIRLIVVLGALLLLNSCKEKQSADKPLSERPCPTMQLPTATELFDLRSKCAALGSKLLDENVIGSALTQEQVSHYNIATGHCYVKLDVHTADLSTAEDKYISSSYLYDGQTKNLLASIDSRSGRKTDNLFDADLRKLSKTLSNEEVSDTIDKFMAEGRKP